MSYEFRIRGVVVLDPERVCQELRALGIECSDPNPLLGTMACARVESSLRPVNVEIDGNQARIRINACSAAADYAVAVEVAEVLMPSSASRFQPQGAADWLPKEELHNRFSESWAREQSAGAFALLAARAAESDSPVVITGTRFNFFVGRRFVGQLPRTDVGRALAQAFHRLQHIDEEGYEIAVHVPLVDGDQFVTAAVWDPRRPMVIRSPNACVAGLDFVQMEEGGNRILFPAAALEAVVGAALEHLDEVSVAVPPRPSEVAGLGGRAREHAWPVERVRKAARRRRRRLVRFMTAMALAPLGPLRARSPGACRGWSAVLLFAAALLFLTRGVPALRGDSGTTLTPLIVSVALLAYGILAGSGAVTFVRMARRLGAIRSATDCRQTSRAPHCFYTVKAMMALRQMIRDGRFTKGQDVCFLHTGGIFGLFPKREEAVA